MYVVALVGVGIFILKGTYNFLPLLMLLLIAILVSVIVETKNLTLEETGTLFDGDGEPQAVAQVSAAQDSTHSIEEDENPSELCPYILT
jgi:hypothetical protein